LLQHDHKILWLDYRGAPQTVAVIKHAAVQSQTKPGVRLLAEEVTKHLPSKDTVSEALAFYNLVLDRTRYMRDPRNVEYVRAPWIVVDQIMAGHTPGLDCDDMTALICALAAVTGAECRAVTVAFKHMHFRGRRQYSHVFAQIREPRTRKWITLDPVAGDKTEEMMSRVVAAKLWPVA
jgi:hypothetical protein